MAGSAAIWSHPPGHRLRVRRSGWRTLELEGEVVDIAVVPVLARLERSDDGVTHLLVMGGRMLCRGVVAATDVPALLADAKMNPVRAPGGETVDASRAGGCDVLDLIEMRACLGHSSILRRRSWHERAREAQ